MIAASFRLLRGSRACELARWAAVASGHSGVEQGVWDSIMRRIDIRKEWSYLPA